jgi:hypothetical protein
VLALLQDRVVKHRDDVGWADRCSCARCCRQYLGMVVFELSKRLALSEGNVVREAQLRNRSAGTRVRSQQTYPRVSSDLFHPPVTKQPHTPDGLGQKRGRLCPGGTLELVTPHQVQNHCIATGTQAIPTGWVDQFIV